MEVFFTCPYCSTEVELSKSEWEEKRFICPFCKKEITPENFPKPEIEKDEKKTSYSNSPIFKMTKSKESRKNGLYNILWGLVFIFGGTSGKLVLRGTNSSIGLVLLGLAFFFYGAFLFYQAEPPKDNRWM